MLAISNCNPNPWYAQCSYTFVHATLEAWRPTNTRTGVVVKSLNDTLGTVEKAGRHARHFVSRSIAIRADDSHGNSTLCILQLRQVAA